MKLLVADKLEEEALAGFRLIPGLEVHSLPGVSQDSLGSALDGVGILVVRSKKVSAEAIASARALSLIVRAGAGTNTIDVKAASARGVFVANCPGKNAVAVAELALGFILALDRRIPDAVRSLREGRWEKSEYGKAQGLLGRRVGIAGLGSIGLELLSRVRALGMVPHAYSRSLTDARAEALGVVRHATLSSLAASSDVLSVHLPLNPDTRGAFSAQVLAAMPNGSLLVNTARAEVMDYDAVLHAVTAGKIRFATDVFPAEPEGSSGVFTHPLTSLPGVYGTPHIGASTSQAQLAIAAETVRIVASFISRGEVPNCVNVLAHSPSRCQLVVRHFDRVGVLASVLGVIKKHGINVGEMTNILFHGNNAACAKIRLSEAPSEACINEINLHPDVLYVERVLL